METRTDLKFLTSLICLTRAKNVVEVGVAWGESTKSLCEGVKHTGGFVRGFDNWEEWGINGKERAYGSLESTQQTLIEAGYSNFELFKFDVIKNRDEFSSFLKEKYSEGIDLAFIDADHSYLGIYNDTAVIYPLLTSNGIIVFHDTLAVDGCREFILDLRTKFNDGTFDIVDFPGGALSHGRTFGVSLLVKRCYSLDDKHSIFYCHGSPSLPAEIEEREQQWLREEISKRNPAELFSSPEMNDKWGHKFDRKKLEEWS